MWAQCRVTVAKHDCNDNLIHLVFVKVNYTICRASNAGNLLWAELCLWHVFRYFIFVKTLSTLSSFVTETPFFIITDSSMQNVSCVEKDIQRKRLAFHVEPQNMFEMCLIIIFQKRISFSPKRTESCCHKCFRR